jgi:hypothetical protein
MIIRLIGRIRAKDLEELKRQMDDSTETKVLDLSEITIVDADVIRFLSVTEREGTGLMGCPPYVREWVLRERAEDGVSNTFANSLGISGRNPWTGKVRSK